MTHIAFLGLGAMGSRMAAKLIAAGNTVTVWNRDAKKAEALAGAKIASSPRAATQGADIIIAMVRDDHASQSVWLDDATGAIGGMKASALAIECSTLSMTHVEKLAGALKAKSLAFVDAPLAGSRPQADGGQLIFFAGGSDGDVTRATPVLQSMGSAVHHTGANGSGAAVKLAVNSLFAIQVSAMAELLNALGKHGVDPTKALDVMAATPVTSPAAKMAGMGMLAKNFAPLFPIELVEKDLGYAQCFAPNAPMLAAARAVMQKAISHGFANNNITGVMQLYT